MTSDTIVTGDNELRELLDAEAARINNPEFIAQDPVQFPRRFEEQPDIEIAALLCSTIAWGRRSMICRNCDKLLAMMGNQPHRFVMERGYEELPDDMNIHRTFFVRNLRHYLRGLREIYSRYPTLDAYAAACGVGESAAPAWELARLLNQAIAQANDSCSDSRCLPQNLTNSALKRLNMALRWLVRRDGIVDMGLWRSIQPSQLYIPLDVHVGNTARSLGILGRRQADRRSVEELMVTLRRWRPDDPVIYDFALFGLGIEGADIP